LIAGSSRGLGAERTEREHVSKQIVHFRSAIPERAQPMFMVPDGVRADPLFIDETMRRIPPNDLRQSGKRNA